MEADRIVVMNDGNVEQVGSPLELYDNPKNRFVATFIGSPSMNLIKGRFKGDGMNVIETPGGDVDAPENLTHLESGREVIYGIRPEHFELADTGLEGSVSVVEPTGSETMVLVRSHGQEIAAVFRDRHHFEPGQTIHLKPRSQMSHVFDPTTGDRI